MHPYYRQTTYTIKVFHPQKLETRLLQQKRVFGSNEYDKLVKNIRTLFEIDENQKFYLTYRDSAGDEISLRTNNDFFSAVNGSAIPRVTIRLESEDIKEEETTCEKSTTSEIDDISSVFSESLQSIMKQLEQGISTLQASVEKSTTHTVDAVVKTAAETAATVYRSMLPAPSLSDKPQFDVICDGCYTPIRGQRWRCETCDDFDLCSACKSRVNHFPQHNFRFIKPSSPPPPQPSISLSMTNKHAVVVTDDSSQSEPSQTIFICDYCDNDVVGIRHSCSVCPDFDLCHSCFSIVNENHPEHIFVTRLVGTQATKKSKIGEGKKQNPSMSKTTTTTTSASPRPSHDGNDNNTDISHPGVECDNCQREITGIRYKCGHCSNYDLCEICEEYAPTLHDKAHAFIKIRYPIQSLVKKPILPTFLPLSYGEEQSTIVNQDLKEMELINHAAIVNTSASSGRSIVSNSDESASSSAPVINIPNSPSIVETENATTTTNEAKQEEELSAAFVSDLNIPDGALVVPNKSFIKMWKVVNNGNVDWPVGTHLLFNGGSILRPYPVTKPNTFMVPVTSPNEEACISAELQAPDCPGEYSSYFCLCTPDGVRFGDSLWCTIKVDLDEEPDHDHKSVNTTSTDATDNLMSSTHSMIYPTIVTAASSIHADQQQDQQQEELRLSRDDFTDHDDYSEFTNDHTSIVTSEAATTHTFTDSHMSSPTSSELDIGERHREDLVFTEEEYEEDNQNYEQEVTQDYQVISPSASTTLPTENNTEAATTTTVVSNEDDDFVIVDEQADDWKKEDEVVSNESNSLDSSVQTITTAATAAAPTATVTTTSNTEQTLHDGAYYRSQLLQLHEMGFTSYDDLAISLLNLHDGRVEDVIAKLLYYP